MYRVQTDVFAPFRSPTAVIFFSPWVIISRNNLKIDSFAKIKINKDEIRKYFENN